MAKFEVVIRHLGPDGLPAKEEKIPCDGYVLAAGEGSNINLSSSVSPPTVLFFLELLREKFVSRQVRVNMAAADQAQMAQGLAVAQSIPKLAFPPGRNNS